jgi:hypothetical protein
MATTSQKTVLYRRARFSESMPQNLQQMLSAALGQLEQVKSRLEATDSGATEFRVVSSSCEYAGFLCGRLTTFERGGFQLVIADEPDAKELPLSALEPPDREGVPHQFTTGILYFCIFQNHVALVQSPSLKSGGFEQHLAWLLRDKTSALTAQQGVALVDEPKQATRDRIKKSHVKSVRLGRPLLEESIAVIPGQRKTQAKFKGSGPVITMIKDLIDSTQFERLGLEECIFDGNLEVWIEIRYPTRSRTSPEDTIRLMDDLALSLRDLDEDQVKLELKDGTKVTGNQLKISGKLDVNVGNTGLIDEQDLYNNMSGWLEALIRDSIVTD